MSTLANIDIFSELPENMIESLSKRCAWTKYDEHETIIDFEDEIGSVYFIVRGKVRVIIRTEGGKEIVLTEIAENNLFGELSAIDGLSRSANVVAMEPTQVGAMSISVFLQSMREYPDMALALMRLLSLRLRALNTRLTEHSFLDAKHRLYNELLRQSRPRKGFDDQRIVSPPPVQKEMAEKISCRREVISRELAKLKKVGVVEVLRGGLVIHDPAKLSKMISDAWDR